MNNKRIEEIKEKLYVLDYDLLYWQEILDEEEDEDLDYDLIPKMIKETKEEISKLENELKQIS